LTSDRPLRINALQAVHEFNDADDRAVYELAGRRRWVGGVLLNGLIPVRFERTAGVDQQGAAMLREPAAVSTSLPP
jgi:hypothetical protein